MSIREETVHEQAQASYSKRVKILPDLRPILTSKRTKILVQKRTEINFFIQYILHIRDSIFFLLLFLTSHHLKIAVLHLRIGVWHYLSLTWYNKLICCWCLLWHLKQWIFTFLTSSNGCWKFIYLYNSYKQSTNTLHCLQKKDEEKERKMSKFIWVYHGSRWLGRSELIIFTTCTTRPLIQSLTTYKYSLTSSILLIPLVLRPFAWSFETPLKFAGSFVRPMNCYFHPQVLWVLLLINPTQSIIILHKASDMSSQPRVLEVQRHI